MTRGAGRGACARGGAGLVEALRSGPDRAEPRRPGPAEERASRPARDGPFAGEGRGPVGEGERAELRFGPERIGLVGFRDGVWVGFLFYFFSYSN